MSETKKYKLLILESPSKAKTIQGYLKDQNFKCIASKGHILELPKKELGVDLSTFELDLQPMSDKKDVIAEIKKLAKDAEEIYLGSDPDREGTGIAAHLRDIIKAGKKPVHRVLFHEITKSAILKAIANPTTIDLQQYDAQKTRRVLDRLVGYKVSPILWQKVGGEAKSAGRVQSVALRLIVDREKEIETFIPEKFFQIVAKLKKNDIVFESKYFGEQIDKKTDLNADNEDLARKINEEVQNKNFIVKSINTKEKKQNPSAPFTTSRLQQEASTKLKFNSKKTMQIAQQLYEGITLGEKGSQGLITYMRTDSFRTEPKALESVREYISKKYGANYLPSEAVIYKKKGGAVQDAHEAIRPTSFENDPESIKKYLSDDEYKLYSLIWNKMVSSQMTPAVLDQTIAMFDVASHYFRSVGTVLKFDGYKAVYVDGDDKKDEDSDGALPKLDLEESLTPIDGPKLLEKFTSPPPRYTESTLIKTLEEKGIGRPSTYSTIISTITDRHYVNKQENKFHPTEIGTTLCDFLVKHFPQEMEYTFTADLEDKLDQIEEGNLVWTNVLKEFWQGLSGTIEKTKKEVPDVVQEKGPRQINPSSRTGIKCTTCNEGEMIILKSKNGEFLGCSRYPDCTHTENFKKTKSGAVKIVEKKETVHPEPCNKCGEKMILREGKFGAYYSCSGYSKTGCKNSRPVSTGVKCPDCGTGEFVKRQGKNGDFYACSSFPNCKNAINSKPVEDPCNKCGYKIRGAKKIKDKVEMYCPKCKDKEVL